MLSSFYVKCFIGIYVDGGTIYVSVLRFKNHSDIELEESSFIFDESLESLVAYLQKFHDLTPYCYTSLLNTDLRQGALSTCILSKAMLNNRSVGNSRTICIDEEWMNYLDEEAYATMIERFKNIAPDMIYIPFSLIHLIFKEKMSSAHSIYILYLKDSASLVIAKESSLRAAKQFDVNSGDLSLQIADMLNKYYSRPCCQGEFIEHVYIADASDSAEQLRASLSKLLLVDATLIDVLPAQLCAIAGAKELGYEPQFS